MFTFFVENSFYTVDGVVMKFLRQQKDNSTKILFRGFPNKPWSQSVIDRLLRQTDIKSSADRIRAVAVS